MDAIPTHYKWATFSQPPGSALGRVVRCPQDSIHTRTRGFQLSRWYLVDLWLPVQKCYVEIKPEPDAASGELCFELMMHTNPKFP
jgi:hypothetical protein